MANNIFRDRYAQVLSLCLSLIICDFVHKCIMSTPPPPEWGGHIVFGSSSKTEYLDLDLKVKLALKPPTFWF